MKFKTILFVMGMLLPILSLAQKIRGVVRASNGNILPHTTLNLKKSNTWTETDANGHFTIVLHSSDSIIFSHTGYISKSLFLEAKDTFIHVQLNPSSDLEEVIVSTGYQQIPKERATGSFVFVDSALLNRRVSANILDRLDGVTSGLLFNKNQQSGQANYNIRGVSTINSNPNPLIVIDNMPYSGDINTINPNDVESVSILKDGAATSIWGAFAGNGVIVITTKKGKFNLPTKVSFNSNITLGDKPNLWYRPQLSSANFISIETILFENGYYDGTISYGYSIISPVVEILNKEKNGDISDQEAQAQLALYQQQDYRNDLKHHFYQKSLAQQYAVSINGGSTNNKYFLSLGYDANQSSLINNTNNRLTLNANNTYAFFHNKLEFTTGIVLIQSRQKGDGSAGSFPYPYLKLVGDDGKALAVPNQYRPSYIDDLTTTLLDWHYRPWDEIHLIDNTTQLTDYRINTQIKYKILCGLETSLSYQYSNGSSQNENYDSEETYYTRNYINQFTRINGTTITRPVPLGGIIDFYKAGYHAHDGRALINYTHHWSSNHELTALAGVELQSLVTQTRSYRLYGYDKDQQTSTNVDYVSLFLNYQGNAYNQIQNNVSNLKTINNYLSYFGNAAYSFRARYIFSVSIRKDQSNLFGVNSNQKGVPLWSTGLGWVASEEQFYHIHWLPYLKLRVTNGYSGNINKSVTALTTANINGINTYNQNYSTITNPPTLLYNGRKTI
ncbi:TonB-dependent receptor plug domain-containing protein [Rhizosphaericola mali]|uniref:TonB-dependent receptor plug domain-containing protein n=1 Tax=Rhizosphaericola mali TaxID=2545455 RepID=A0A5P2G3P7_9BACT|nr:TonB-dependent receptor plug domain-containing protein [Rhizosphaericola mali]QES88749.1 TonB-dependent receptor plug domain-containing protein [Rhizosphaericola mali]